MNLLRLLILLLLFKANYVAAQNFQNVMISNSFDPNETSICISRLDTNMIVAAANLNNVYRSADGGFTWSELVVGSSYGVFGDPCIVSDTAGNFYYLHLAQNPSIVVWPAWADRIVCQKSQNNGNSWSNGTFTGLNQPRMQDKEWAYVDPRTNYMSVTWTEFDRYASTTAGDSTRIFFSISKDGAQTWQTPVQVSAMQGDCLDEDNTVEGAMSVINDRGEAFVVWAYNDSLYLNKSEDTGRTWLPREIAIAAQPGGWDYNIEGILRCNGLPVTCIDRSNSTHSGNIYVNWTDKRNGSNDADVFIIRSTDNGLTWSDPLRVNDDAPGKENFMSWMDVDPITGRIHIVFYDRRNYSDTKTDVYWAYSDDGGVTFTNQRISSSPFIPSPPVFFGDYIGISAFNNCIRPVWMRLDNTNLSVWTAIVSFDQAITATPPDTNEKKSGYIWMGANPVKNHVQIYCDSNKPFTATIYDIGGKLIHSETTKGDVFSFDLKGAGFSNGAYIVRCTSELETRDFRFIFAQ